MSDSDAEIPPRGRRRLNEALSAASQLFEADQAVAVFAAKDDRLGVDLRRCAAQSTDIKPLVAHAFSALRVA